MPKRSESRSRATRSSSEVFRDLGFSEAEAQHLRVRGDLMIQIEKVLAARKLEQAEAARIMCVTQPRVRDLLRGRIDLFSSDALIGMLARLGLRVRLVVSPAGSCRVA